MSISESNASETKIYCPGCAAAVDPDFAPNSRTLRCPVCGTQFEYAGNEDTADQTIARAEAIPSVNSPRRPSTEEILLERLKNEPPPRRSISGSAITLILLGIIALGVGLYYVTRTPDTYASHEHEADQQLAREQAAMKPVLDSLNAYVRMHPYDAGAHLNLANVLYNASMWKESKSEYEAYLQIHPDSVSARVDYAYAIAQATGDFSLAVAQIDTALKYKPDYLPGLFNGGVLSGRIISGSNHAEALARSRSYFLRAKAVADTSAPFMAKQIDTILITIDRKAGTAAPRPQ